MYSKLNSTHFRMCATNGKEQHSYKLFLATGRHKMVSQQQKKKNTSNNLQIVTFVYKDLRPVSIVVGEDF